MQKVINDFYCCFLSFGCAHYPPITPPAQYTVDGWRYFRSNKVGVITASSPLLHSDSADCFWHGPTTSREEGNFSFSLPFLCPYLYLYLHTHVIGRKMENVVDCAKIAQSSPLPFQIKYLFCSVTCTRYTVGFWPWKVSCNQCGIRLLFYTLWIQYRYMLL